MSNAFHSVPRELFAMMLLLTRSSGASVVFIKLMVAPRLRYFSYDLTQAYVVYLSKEIIQLLRLIHRKLRSDVSDFHGVSF